MTPSALLDPAGCEGAGEGAEEGAMYTCIEILGTQVRFIGLLIIVRIVYARCT